MKHEMFPEMRWLWERWERSGRPPLCSADRRARHMAPPVNLPVTLLAAAGIYANGAGLTAPLRLLLTALGVYAFWFLITLVHRQNWKDLCADDLAFMLTSPPRHWLASRIETIRQQTGEPWDDPTYRVCYTPELEPVVPPTEKEAIREVLGRKENGRFQPGRYFANLKEGKKSVSRLVRTPDLELHHLLPELTPGSAGHRFVSELLEGGLPRGLVEVSIWARDPRTDLTSSRDFFSSASLRGESWKEALKRRTKGVLGPFGYLRNPSISALDFRTGEGRCVRARLAAATSGTARVLFVDAVEGRYDIKPRLIKKAIEDYAKACGFDCVAYHAHPLNKVPRRFIQSLGGQPVQLRLELLDASQREYLDAFGWPLEPFEYAFPRGVVSAYVTSAKGLELTRQTRFPKHLALPLLAGASCLTLAGVLFQLAPAALPPTLGLFALAWIAERRH